MKMPSEAIRDEIRKKGAIPFARFMELALYCPETGYYEANRDNVGRGGDFYTSVSTGELFGQLLAFQSSVWLGELARPDGPLQIVEAGAHDGKLAADILGWWRQHRPRLYPRLEYGILEPSPRRQSWQRETLKPFLPQLRWYDSLADLGAKNPDFSGLIFSNELLDAMPVHRLAWNAPTASWFEWGVGLVGEGLVWEKMPVSPNLCRHAGSELPAELLAVLPDGFLVEVSPAAADWWRAAASVLKRGRLLAIDYGLVAAERFQPARGRGTLRAYSRHRVTEEVLANAGGQDLTAHVDFSELQAAGEAAGMATELFQTQPQFLTRILGQAVKDPAFAEWSASRARQFQTLTHPEHLGRAFRVLGQFR